jgi:hypothetical protein
MLMSFNQFVKRINEEAPPPPGGNTPPPPPTGGGNAPPPPPTGDPMSGGGAPPSTGGKPKIIKITTVWDALENALGGKVSPPKHKENSNSIKEQPKMKSLYT